MPMKRKKKTSAIKRERKPKKRIRGLWENSKAEKNPSIQGLKVGKLGVVTDRYRECCRAEVSLGG